jgi:hypothetical protein
MRDAGAPVPLTQPSAQPGSLGREDGRTIGGATL